MKKHSFIKSVSSSEHRTVRIAPEEITKISLDLFLAYARDAGNWSGNPLVGGNVGGSKEERGNLTQLKQAGLIDTFVSDGFTWISFTDAGRTFALKHGVEIKD